MPFGSARLGFWYRDHPKIIELPPGSSFQYVAEYITITYYFNTGLDLDTRSKLTYSQGGVVGDYLGWGRNGNSTFSPDKNLEWGGDNTGVGLESVLFKSSKTAQSMGNVTVTISCRGQWYNTMGTTPVNVIVKLFKGGTMIKSGFGWTNPTAIQTVTVASVSKYVTRQSNEPTSIGESIATLTYNTVTGYGGFS